MSLELFKIDDVVVNNDGYVIINLFEIAIIPSHQLTIFCDDCYLLIDTSSFSLCRNGQITSIKIIKMKLLFEYNCTSYIQSQTTRKLTHLQEAPHERPKPTVTYHKCTKNEV